MNKGKLIKFLAICFRLIFLSVALACLLGVYALYALVVEPAVTEKDIYLEAERAFLLKSVEDGQYKEVNRHGDISQ